MITVGVDISKLKIDIYCEIEGKNINKTFFNNKEGFEALLKLLPQDNKVRIAMEATGNYGYDLANYMYNHKAIVHVINPAQVKYYARSLLLRSKTDKVDAKLIHKFATEREDLQIWKPLSSSYQRLRNLARCRQNFKRDITDFGNRIESEKDKQVVGLYEEVVVTLKDKLGLIEEQIRELVKGDKELSTKVELLESIPGIGEITAWLILAELPDLNQFKNAKQLAAYAGLNPAVKQSGSSVNGRGSISKIGSSNLRLCLYFPAITALKHNNKIKGFCERLKEKGKRPKVVIVAAMHKLLRIVFAILRSGEPFIK